MIIQFNIPNQKLQRIADVLPSFGYTFDPNLGTTDAQQKEVFLKHMTINWWKGLVANTEKQQFIQADLQALLEKEQTYQEPDFTDIV